MRRLIPLVVICLCCVVTQARAATPVELFDVQANGSIEATAAHGPFVGDTGDLLDLLNDGGSATLEDTGDLVTISSTGMFSTAGLPDTREGFPLGDLVWTFLGKSDDADFGPFTDNPGTPTGTLTLDTAISGNVVIALKASNGYAVYAFQDLFNVTTFSFDTRAIGNGRHDLGHASLYTAPAADPIPEPASLIVWCALGMACFGAARIRKRRKGSN